MGRFTFDGRDELAYEQDFESEPETDNHKESKRALQTQIPIPELPAVRRLKVEGTSLSLPLSLSLSRYCRPR
jgi:hypothetical protein